MDYEQMKAEVKQIAEIASSVPEQFRDKCFELLLNHLMRKPASTSEAVKDVISEGSKIQSKGDNKRIPPSVDGNGDKGRVSTIPITTQLRLLMLKTSVTQEELDKVLMYDSGELHFIKEPRGVKVTVGQIEWSLLLALKNAILKDSLSVDPEDVRSLCQEKGFYDSSNFAASFKRANYAKLFKGLMVNQGEAQQLTPDGQETLGKIIKRLAGESQ